MIFAKHRNGATGDVRLIFLKNYSKFANPARAGQEPPGVKDVRA